MVQNASSHAQQKIPLQLAEITKRIYWAHGSEKVNGRMVFRCSLMQMFTEHQGMALFLSHCLGFALGLA
jgi:hypothetical protein